MSKTENAEVRLSTRRIWEQDPAVDCCTSCAIAACLEAIYPEYDVLSPIFHYRQSGAAPNAGLNPYAALVLAKTHEIPLHQFHPYGLTLADLEKRPDEDAVRDARARRLTSPVYYQKAFQRLPSSDRQHHLHQALSRGHSVLLVIWLNAAYEAMRGGIDEWDPAPAPRTRLHAVALIGYEESTNRFVVQDSRGTDFAAGG